MFDRKVDAEDFDLKARTGVVLTSIPAPVKSDHVFSEYAEQWRLSREVGWVVETRRRIESNIRLHLNPAFGNAKLRSITLTSVLEWLSRLLAAGRPKSSVRLYFELLDTILNAAVTDRSCPTIPATASGCRRY